METRAKEYAAARQPGMRTRWTRIGNLRRRDGRRKVPASITQLAGAATFVTYVMGISGRTPDNLRSFVANSAWLVLVADAFNLTRAAGTIVSLCHAKVDGESDQSG